MKGFISDIPEMLELWHTTKNSLNPNQTTSQANVIAWWICPFGHEWSGWVISVFRSHKNNSKTKGCPYCHGKKIIENDPRSLAMARPDLAQQWHPLKNSINPSNVYVSSNKKYWWLCENGHEWEGTPNGRSNEKRTGKCPYCNNRIVSNDNNFLFKFPDIAKQWDFTKNINLKPESFLPGSPKKVWWICPENQKHSWATSIHKRVNGHGCPLCCTSKGQIELFEILYELFDGNILINFKDPLLRFNCTNRPMEFDFYIPSINLRIEYDGKQHFEARGNESIERFNNRVRRDIEKRTKVREANLPFLELDYKSNGNIETIKNKIAEIAV
jgi:hypothetical protein